MPLSERLPLTSRTRQWPVWGTLSRITVTDPDQAGSAQALVSRYLDRVDAACSRFRPDSELAFVQALCAARPGIAVPISSLLAGLVAAALDAGG